MLGCWVGSGLRVSGGGNNERLRIDCCGEREVR